MSRATPYFNKLSRYYLWYTACFGGFLASLALLEQEGMPRLWIGYSFMFATIVR
jgi:cation/acetate symporter